MADLDKPAELQEDVCSDPGAPADETASDLGQALKDTLDAPRPAAGQPSKNLQGSQPELDPAADELVKWIGSPAELDQQLEQVLLQQRQLVPAHAGVGAPTISDRRSSPRQRLTSLICATVDSTNGGILLNLSKGGLAIRVVDSLLDGQHVDLSFCLKPTGAHIKACGQVAWVDASRHTAGIRFVDLPPASGEQLEAWLCDMTSPSPQEGEPQQSAAPSDEVETPDTVKSLPISDSTDSSGAPPTSLEPQSEDESESATEGFRERFAEDLNGSRKWIVAGMIAGIAAIIIFGIAAHSPTAIALFRSWPRNAKATVELARRLLRGEGPPVATGQHPTANTEKPDHRPAANATSRPRPSGKALAGQPGKSEPTPTTSAFPKLEVQGNNEWRLIRDPAAQAVAVGIAAAGRQFHVSYEFSGPAPESVVLPPYPQQARQNAIQGAVVVRAVIGTDGKLGDVRVLSGDPTLAAAVEPVIKAWRYEEGKSATETRITVRFTIVKH